MVEAKTTAPVISTPILSVNNIEVIYDHVILVLKGVSLSVPQGGITALLGANGAGKTTTLKAISNLLRTERGEVTKGSIVFDGREVQALSPDKLVRRGCIQVLEGRRCFGHLSVEDNLAAGAFTRRDGKAAIRADLDLVYDYFPRLRERRSQLAGSLSGGEQQMLAMGRALISGPKLILVDELSLGLMPKVVDECYAVLHKLKEAGVAIILVEQNTERALAAADEVCVLEAGNLSWRGSASEAHQNENLVAALLGQ